MQKSVAFVALVGICLFATGCASSWKNLSMPRWDWWRSAKKSEPTPPSYAAAGQTQPYGSLPSAAATPYGTMAGAAQATAPGSVATATYPGATTAYPGAGGYPATAYPATGYPNSGYPPSHYPGSAGSYSGSGSTAPAAGGYTQAGASNQYPSYQNTTPYTGTSVNTYGATPSAYAHDNPPAGGYVPPQSGPYATSPAAGNNSSYASTQGAAGGSSDGGYTPPSYGNSGTRYASDSYESSPSDRYGSQANGTNPYSTADASTAPGYGTTASQPNYISNNNSNAANADRYGSGAGTSTSYAGANGYQTAPSTGAASGSYVPYQPGSIQYAPAGYSTGTQSGTATANSSAYPSTYPSTGYPSTAYGAQPSNPYGGSSSYR